MQVWNDKIILDNDGWGYRITEGDEGEVVLIYFEEMTDGKKETELGRICGTDYIRAIGQKLIEKADEMDAAQV